MQCWFAVEQSGGVVPARVYARVFGNYHYDDPLVLVARHHQHSIELTVNGISSGLVDVDGYGRLDTNEDSRLGELVGFSDEYQVPGRYHRWGILHDHLDDQQVGVLTATWLADVGFPT